MIDLRSDKERKEAKAFMNVFRRSKKFTRKDFFRILKYTFLTFLFYTMLFEPQWLGEIIGKWIQNFFGTIYKQLDF